MSCSRTTLIAVSLMLGAACQLSGWGQPMEPVHLRAQPAENPSFPLSQDQQWYVKESYLLWHPSEDDVDWADRGSFSTTSDVDISVRIKKPDFGWYSGVRLAAGRYLSHHDHWDVSLTGTYFYANTEDHSSPSFAKNGILRTTWAVNDPSIGFNKGEGTWRLNFFTADMALGRNVFISSKITAHPFLALRGVFVNENDAAHYTFRDTSPSPVIGNVKFKFKGQNNFWGVGPRLGSDFTFYMKKYWTLIGSLSGSVLMGSYAVGETMHLNQAIFPSTHRFRATDNGFAVRGNLEGSLGFGWEKWVRDHTFRVAPSIVLEAAQWYDMNQWMTLGNMIPSSASNSEFSRRHGDLTLWGFNFNLQVDF